MRNQSNDLNHLIHKTLDVVKVFYVVNIYELVSTPVQNMRLKLVWERKEKTEKDVKIEEIEKEMRQLSKKQEELANKLENLK
ncbi:MAG TPA: hypothetical protein DDW91_08250 [Shewanella frigidimarina]|nr:hypothetical protein [Shewanella frigidimarina]